MTDHILSSLALAQVSATGLIISFILFFSEKELNSDLLREKTTVFLENDLLVSLDLITVKDAEGEVVPLAVSILPKEECIDQFGRVYTLKSKDNVMRMWVGLNVNRILILYFLKLPDGIDAEKMGDEFMITFSGAKSVGYGVDYLTAEFPEENILCIRASCILGGDDFLNKPAQKLFWANDVALMTQSMFRTALRKGIPTETVTLPHPV